LSGNVVLNDAVIGLPSVSTGPSTTEDVIVGLKFDAVAIPVNSIILSASIQFESNNADTLAGTPQILVSGVKQGNVQSFSTLSRAITNLPRTTQQSTWLPSPWSGGGLRDPAQRAANLTAVVQEIVNQPAWASGNAIGFVFERASPLPLPAPFRSAKLWSSSSPSLSVTFTSLFLVSLSLLII
jgi:hypothetical protein